MKDDELWNHLCERYPEFRNEEHIVKMTARGLRRMVETAWNEGHTQGVANGKAMEAMRRDHEKKNDPLRGLFGL